MDVTLKTKKFMVKDEVPLLVDLIQSNPILISKETNATTNKSKDDAWTHLAHVFNARSGSVPRSKEQLRFKWDNLKKAARKRAQQIRMNNLKTGGGKPDYIPPDEILEKVSGILGSTCSGLLPTTTITRNLAIASYYDKKKEKLDLQIKLLKLELTQKENKT